MTTTSRLRIDLGAVRHNYRLLAAQAKPARCAAVVKADAYGLGLDRIAPALAGAGCRSFFVAHSEEGFALRRLLQDADIFVLNGIAEDWRDAVDARLTPVLNSVTDVRAWQDRASTQPLPVALHIDTGMNRLGIDSADLAALTWERLDLKLILSHLAIAEHKDHALNDAQLRCLQNALTVLPPAPVSLANSSGVFLNPAFRFDLVRPGAALYGVNPTPGAPNPMRNVVTWEARVLQIRTVSPPATIGYSAHYTPSRAHEVATLGIGYGDGLPRALGNTGMVAFGGKRLPIVGHVSMDLITIDCSGLPPGTLTTDSWIEIIGPNLPLDEVAASAGTIGYEILTRLGQRPTRTYEESD